MLCTEHSLVMSSIIKVVPLLITLIIKMCSLITKLFSQCIQLSQLSLHTQYTIYKYAVYIYVYTG